jgi:hypothetical protein
MLSVTVPAKAMVGLAEPETAARITELLEQIPTEVPLSSLSSSAAHGPGPCRPALERTPQHKRQPLGNRRHNRKQDHG